jgi:LPS export ABC transporter protein LptC
VYGINQFLEQLFQPIAVKTDNKNAPDSFFKDFLIRTYDENGKLNKTIKSPKMSYYKNQDTKIKEPQINITRDDTTWQITAKNAHLDKNDNNKVTLNDSVKIVNNQGFELSAEQLSLDDDFIYVNQKLSMQHENNNIIADSMLIDLKDDIITFNQVQGIYEDN